MGYAQIFDICPDSLRDKEGSCGVGAGEDDGELFAAIAGYKVGRTANGIVDGMGNGAETVVAG